MIAGEIATTANTTTHGMCIALELSSGMKLWEAKMEGRSSALAVVGSQVLVTGVQPTFRPNDVALESLGLAEGGRGPKTCS